MKKKEYIIPSILFLSMIVNFLNNHSSFGYSDPIQKIVIIICGIALAASLFRLFIFLYNWPKNNS